MKTTTKLPALFLIISMMFASSTFANNKSIDFEDEAYIDDIPFNTEEIAANYLYEKALTVEFEMAEEEYIDDIPFNTRNIAEQSLYNRAGNEEFTFND